MHKERRRTKIVATVGPACSSIDMLDRLIHAGVDLFRLNFSHGSIEDKQNLITLIRRSSHEIGREVGILADLQGPKIRTGRMAGEGMLLTKGQEVVITTSDVLGDNGRIPTVYTELPRDARPGAAEASQGAVRHHQQADDQARDLRRDRSGLSALRAEGDGDLLRPHHGARLP